jgi:quinohemoprotein ethanol dehydrogenase
MRRTLWILLAASGLWLAYAQQGPRPVDANALRRAAASEWLGYGRDYAETHYSPLTQISAATVSRLGLAYTYDPEGPAGNIESTPIVANGIVYSSLPWGVIFAADARSGKFKWRYDPEIPRTGPERPSMCCGPINRGVAIYNGRIYAALIDGRLVALDAETGKLAWSAQTTEKGNDTTNTAAVRVVKGKVIVGTAGAEFATRGYFSAYDAQTGKMAWRFYTVPGDPSKGFEHKELAKAAETWTGEWWKAGGGGTVWDAMAYDADADILYVGTGNGAPWNRQYRSPGGGDNLYLCSILAVKPDTGRLVWHYQTTPGETWDYTSVQNLILAELPIKGRTRKVILQAPKNGFFYVLDRLTGEFLSAEPFTTVTWAKAIDPTTGRPIENPGMRYLNGPVTVSPGSGGGHNWHPMAFNPQTGLVYIPGSVSSRLYTATADFKPEHGKQITGVYMNDFSAGIPVEQAKVTNAGNFLKAWDPTTQTARWTVDYPNGGFSGGVLTTAGNLVFAAAGDGRLTAYTADKGAKVWEMRLAPGVSTPVTYELDGRQYISVLAGRGGATPGRLYTFVLDGTAPLPAPAPPATTKR